MPDDIYSASRDEEEKTSVGGSSHPAEVEQPEFIFKTSNPFFVRDLEYTRAEEARVIRILDTRLLPWVLLTTCVLTSLEPQSGSVTSANLELTAVSQIRAQHGPHEPLQCDFGRLTSRSWVHHQRGQHWYRDLLRSLLDCLPFGLCGR